MIQTEKDYWDQAKKLLRGHEVTYDANWKFDFINDPKHLVSHLSKCKFAMRMASQGRNILELGCEIGIGASIIGEMAKSYLGVDQESKSIEIARKNFFEPKYKFLYGDYLNKYGTFDSIISFDVLDRIKSKDQFLAAVVDQLVSSGILILGVSANGSADVKAKLDRYFFQAWDFGITNELVHTNAEAPYRIFLCCHKK